MYYKLCKILSNFLLYSVDRSLWNLDLCVLLLPAISDLIQSKYSRYVMSAKCDIVLCCNKWILLFCFRYSISILCYQVVGLLKLKIWHQQSPKVLFGRNVGNLALPVVICGKISQLNKKTEGSSSDSSSSIKAKQSKDV